MSKRPVGGGELVSVGAGLHFLQLLCLHVAVWPFSLTFLLVRVTMASGASSRARGRKKSPNGK